MKKTKILVIIAFLTTSCIKEWLDVMPATMRPANVMFETYRGFQDVLMGAYQKMKHRNLWGEHLTITTMEFLAQHWEVRGNLFNPDVVEAFKRHDWRDENVRQRFQSIYDGLFNVIVQVNTILEALPITGERAILDPALRAIIEGEALAIRGKMHFEILRIFGQLPRRSTISVRLPYSRTVSRQPVNFYDYADFVRLIENDLNRAAELLGEHDPVVHTTFAATNTHPDHFLRFRRLRLNYWAVRALQARFYMYTDNPAKAREKALYLIDASARGDFSITTNAMNLNESYRFFALPGESLFTLAAHQLASYANELLTSSNVILYMSPERMEGDGRVFGLFGEPFAASLNNRFNSVWARRATNIPGLPFVFRLQKYEQTTTRVGTDLMLNIQIIPMLRMSEMYLIAMEASTDMNEINELYDAYRIVRNILPTVFTNRHEVMDMIEREYRREFFGEGQMFFFYKRHRAVNMPWANRTIFEADYIVPLPDTEFDPNIRN